MRLAARAPPPPLGVYCSAFWARRTFFRKWEIVEQGFEASVRLHYFLQVPCQSLQEGTLSAAEHIQRFLACGSDQKHEQVPYKFSAGSLLCFSWAVV